MNAPYEEARRQGVTRTCKRCGHLESVHDDIDGCQVVTGCTPGSMRMEACDCEEFVPKEEASS
jgi:formylmethanofuran dehydrogenase subunit E